MARFPFNKFGIACDPRGAHIVWNDGQRDYLATVVDAYRDPVRGVTMLKTRYFCGDEAPDVAASHVEYLERTFEEAA